MTLWPISTTFTAANSPPPFPPPQETWGPEEFYENEAAAVSRRTNTHFLPPRPFAWRRPQGKNVVPVAHARNAHAQKHLQDDYSEPRDTRTSQLFLPCKTGPAQNERKVRRKINGKWGEHRQKIGWIHKHVGGKTADGVPCLSFST